MCRRSWFFCAVPLLLLATAFACPPILNGGREGEGEGDDGDGPDDEGEGEGGEGEGEGGEGEGDEGEGGEGEGGEGEGGEGEEGEGDEGEGEGGEGEAQPPECAEGLPPPSDPCIPFCGNEKGVGQPCTEGGGECNGFIGTGAGFCTIDFDDGAIAFCTKPCREDDQCGSNSVCRGDPDDPGGSKGCIPVACAPDDEP